MCREPERAHVQSWQQFLERWPGKQGVPAGRAAAARQHHQQGHRSAPPAAPGREQVTGVNAYFPDTHIRCQAFERSVEMNPVTAESHAMMFRKIGNTVVSCFVEPAPLNTLGAVHGLLQGASLALWGIECVPGQQCRTRRHTSRPS